ncbi:uncharacterized protein JCM6883_004310 [Sporobolomyces salmoneus]|uniref:uncharacterized protein n=1 Tax=Sporobolomyces salmoneus TaxID=183962 RepID=UPI00317928E6
MDSSLLYFTLAFALISLLCASYTTLRTLLSLVPGHPLNRRRQLPTTIHDSKNGILTETAGRRPRLKSAQRFTAYLAITDVFATCILLWEVASAVSSKSSNLGYSKLSDTRLYLATTARPTILLIVAVLSYANVIQGRSISLGFADYIVWAPALVFYVVGSSLASLENETSPKVWIGLIAWLSSITLIVSFCFSRLLVAILRVRSLTRKEEVDSLRQENTSQRSSNDDLPYHQRYSLTFHPNFSNLSTNFVTNIGRSSRGPPSQDVIFSRPSMSIRQALVKEAWRDQQPPGTGHAPKVELSQKEAKGAIVRLGGHLFSSLLGYALVSPFICLRIAKPSSSSNSLLVSFLLVIGVCQPSLVLAYQCWTSEGFWFRQAQPPVLTSSTANEFDRVEVVSKRDLAQRAESRASTWKDSLPGIRPDGEDCDADRKSRIGRALSILSTHPKLQLLNAADEEPNSVVGSTSGFVKSAPTTGHVRLRSLKLSKGTIASMGHPKPSRPRAGSSASRKTVGGFEHARNTSAPATEFDRAIAMRLLSSRPKTPNPPIGSEPSDYLSRQNQTPSLSPSPTPSPVPLPHEFDFSYREISLETDPSSTTASASDPRESTRPISIDFLSSQVLPQLVPSLRIGSSLQIDSRSGPIPTPPKSMNVNARRRMRNVRSLSLPLSTNTTLNSLLSDGGAQAEDEIWIAVDEDESVPSSKGAEEEEEHRVELSPKVESIVAKHERSASSSIRLDISFDWEAVDETEVLEGATIAGESLEGTEEDQRRCRSNAPSPTAPFTPILPLNLSRRPLPVAQSAPSPRGSIVHKGSRVSSGSGEEDEDVHTSTFHCATVRPVVRGLRNQTESIGSTVSSITSEGFKNLLHSAGNSWHAPPLVSPIDATSSVDQAQHHSYSLPRRPLPTPPPLQPGLRPLSLLGQRDSNQQHQHSAGSDSETESLKTSRYSAARQAEWALPASITARSFVPLPPIPTTIDEAEEDRKSRTPTPKSTRTLKETNSISKPTLATKQGSTARTPPNVTSRTKLRSRHQRNASSLSLNDENVNLPTVTKTPERGGRMVRGEKGNVTRGMR